MWSVSFGEIFEVWSNNDTKLMSISCGKVASYLLRFWPTSIKITNIQEIYWRIEMYSACCGWRSKLEALIINTSIYILCIDLRALNFIHDFFTKSLLHILAKFIYSKPWCLCIFGHFSQDHSVKTLGGFTTDEA